LKVSIPPAKLIQIIKDTTPKKSVANRRSEGSPSPQKQIKSIKNYRILLEKYVNEVQDKKVEVERVQENITSTINRIKAKRYTSR
jgi:hypothetical protein